jgi:hypothetical protein
LSCPPPEVKLYDGIRLGIPQPTEWQQLAADHGQEFHLAGYLYCIILLYTLVIVYVTRCIVLSYFLRALVAAARPLCILPLHPDKCGGLRPVGRLGLRNQYTLTILGINIVLLLVTWW